ncbi:MAG: acetyl-CoA carboxylase biotin carboxyl carrier protein subunit [Conexivisphaerales archaeon]
MTLFELYCQDRKLALEVKDADGYYLVNYAGRVFRVELRKEGINRYRAKVDNDVFKIRFIDEGLESYTLEVDGYIIEYRRKPKNDGEAKIRTASVIVSPLPGRILEIKVKKNQNVNLGDELIVIESMKMQTTLRAERNGTVKEVLVTEGDIIKRGQPVIEFTV